MGRATFRVIVFLQAHLVTLVQSSWVLTPLTCTALWQIVQPPFFDAKLFLGTDF
jgi:hypothetical protein